MLWKDWYNYNCYIWKGKSLRMHVRCNNTSCDSKNIPYSVLVRGQRNKITAWVIEMKNHVVMSAFVL